MATQFDLVAKALLFYGLVAPYSSMAAVDGIVYSETHQGVTASWQALTIVMLCFMGVTAHKILGGLSKQ